MSARILIIEDNKTNLGLVVFLLKKFKYAYSTAMTGREGLDLIRRDKPDVVICDVQLPDISGHEIVREVKADPALRHISMIAVTAMAMVGDRERLLAAGFDGYIAKPIEAETFIPSMEKFLRADLRQGQPASALPKSVTALRPVQATVAKATILVIDNSSTNIGVIRRTLESVGYRVVSALNLKSALALKWASPPDLILCDVHMPDGNGFEALTAVRKHESLRTSPFVFLSSTIWLEQDRARGLAMGAQRFVARPAEPEALIAEVADCLAVVGR
ncbi:MAG: response regulator [Rhodospirillaceae bacterium]|nr:MAG: response regulator [Rhodospirillaceae bacterium]